MYKPAFKSARDPRSFSYHSYRNMSQAQACQIRRFRLAAQSQRPSFQPVRHRCSHRLQLNCGLPSLSLTSLCAAHSQRPKSSRDAVRTGDLDRKTWKSSAHTQHGYSRDSVPTKPLTSACWLGVGCVGYCAAIVCSSVQVPRPSVSTSAGQSAGGPGAAAAVAAVVAAMAAAAAVPAEPDDEGDFKDVLVWLAHDAKEVQDRHGLPSLPSTTPFGILLGDSAPVAGCSGCRVSADIACAVTEVDVS